MEDLIWNFPVGCPGVLRSALRGCIDQFDSDGVMDLWQFIREAVPFSMRWVPVSILFGETVRLPLHPAQFWQHELRHRDVCA